MPLSIIQSAGGIPEDSVKAFVVFDGMTGQVISSKNIDHVTVLTGGLYQVYFAQEMSSANYCIAGSASIDTYVYGDIGGVTVGCLRDYSSEWSARIMTKLGNEYREPKFISVAFIE